MPAPERPLKLAVIGESFLEPDRQGTNSRALNETLSVYRRRFGEVHYIGPGLHEETRLPAEEPGVLLSTVAPYHKPLRQRLRMALHYPRIRRRFAALIRSGPADVVQIRLGLFALAAYPVVRRLGVPLTTYMGVDWEHAFAANYAFPGRRAVGAWLDALQRPALRHSAPVVTGPALARKYAHCSRCHVYLSTTHHTVVDRVPRHPPRRLLFAGHFEPRKRVEDAIEATALLARGGCDVSLAIAGEGPLRAELELRARRGGVSDRVRFLGYVGERDGMGSVYLDADILLLPSVSEGTPRVLAEAMAHAVVPIAVAGAGSNDVILDHGRNGVLVPPASPTAIAAAVRRLRNDKAAYLRLARNGLAYAREHTLDRETDRMWHFVFERLFPASAAP